MVLPRLIPRLSRSAFKVAQANNRVFNAPFRGMASSAGAGSGKIRYVTQTIWTSPIGLDGGGDSSGGGADVAARIGW